MNNETRIVGQEPASAQEAVAIEQVAQQWDGCMYDAPGETIDIGQAIRAVGKRLAPVAAAPVCADCSTPLLYECIGCSATNYPPSTPAAPGIDPDALDRLRNLVTYAGTSGYPSMGGDIKALLDAFDTSPKGGDDVQDRIDRACDKFDDVYDGISNNKREAIAAALAVAYPAPKGGSDAPNLFWNDADPERAFDSIIELVSREWSNGSVVAGDVMEIQQAIRLPNIKVRVVESEDDGVDYEEAPNTPSVCPKCSGTGFVECGKSGPFVRSGSIQCGCMQATSAEVKP